MSWQGPWVGQIRVNLAEKERRSAVSHAVTLWIRPAMEEIARKYKVRLKIAEVPPGPPVLQTLVGEVYGPPGASYASIITEAERLKENFLKTRGVVDVDTTVETAEPRFRFLVDRQKAALSGLNQAQIARGLAAAQAGETVGRVHLAPERLPLSIFLRTPVAWRSSTLTLGQLYFKNPQGTMVPLQELGQFDLDLAPKSIMRKNLERVVFVTGDTAGVSPVNAILDLMADTDKTPPPPGYRVNYAGEGEWKITVQVFRDLGIAFAGGPVGIYILLVLQTSSFTLPLVIMVAIPLTMIGVMPGFALKFSLHPAGAGLWQPHLLHRHRHDRHDRPGGHRGAQLHHPHRLHPPPPGPGVFRWRKRCCARGRCGFGPSCSRPWRPCSAPGSSPWTPSSRGWPGPSSSGSSPPPPSPWWWCR